MLNNRIALAALVVLGSFTVLAQDQEKPRPGFLTGLEKGQTIALKEIAGRYEITIVENGPGMLGHTITEIGPDYVVIEDVAKVSATTVPVYSVKAIVRLKIPKK